jgi:uncharacterized membrane protein YkoI
MNIKRTLIAGTAVAVLAAGGAAVAVAAGGDDDATEKPITGSALDRASAAALADTPGRVTGTEAEDEEGAYEVEVTRSDGTQVDVHLDSDFNVMGTEGDGRDDDGQGDD